MPKTAANAAAVAAAGPEVVGWVAALHVVALVLGYLIPAGVGSPARTCRTSAFQVGRPLGATGGQFYGLCAAVLTPGISDSYPAEGLGRGQHVLLRTPWCQSAWLHHLVLHGQFSACLRRH